MADPQLPPGNFSFWQRGLAVLVAVASVIGAAIAGLFLLYIILTILALGVIAAGAFYLWRRFLRPRPSRPPGHEDMRIREDADGIIIDVDTADHDKNGQR